MYFRNSNLRSGPHSANVADLVEASGQSWQPSLAKRVASEYFKGRDGDPPFAESFVRYGDRLNSAQPWGGNLTEIEAAVPRSLRSHRLRSLYFVSGSSKSFQA
jgi:hypothetical protein